MNVRTAHPTWLLAGAGGIGIRVGAGAITAVLAPEAALVIGVVGLAVLAGSVYKANIKYDPDTYDDDDYTDDSSRKHKGTAAGQPGQESTGFNPNDVGLGSDVTGVRDSDLQKIPNDVRAEDVVERIGRNKGLIDDALEEFSNRVHNAAEKIGADRTFQELIEDAYRNLPNE